MKHPVAKYGEYTLKKLSTSFAPVKNFRFHSLKLISQCQNLQFMMNVYLLGRIL